MHVLPRVRELHERFADVLSVIGVHAGKFTTERRTERIASAADRLGVHHAIVNDRQFRIWRSFAVEAWPTIALVDAEGYLVGRLAGEFDTESVAQSIERTVKDAEAKGILVRGPEPYLKPRPPEGGVLRFPSRAVQVGDHLFVSDSGHGRVVEVELAESLLQGRIVREWDGFAEPQGLTAGPGAAAAGQLFLADRAGHSVWRLGPGSADRQLIAGTGQIGQGRLPSLGVASEVDLRSPWGLLHTNGHLLVTMAGSHQTYALSLDTGELELTAGSGAEAVRDGMGSEAALAQPTGLAQAAGDVFVADCESSAVRSMSEQGDIRTIVGTGLFDFGDRDGMGDDVRLQHCLDLAWANSALAVADTYNDRLKRVDVPARACSAWPGEAGEAGSLREPGGVSVGVWRSESAGNSPDDLTLIVADTGNHRIVRVQHDGSLAPIAIEED